MISVTRTKFGVSIGEVFFAAPSFKPSRDAAIWFLVQAAAPSKYLHAVKTQVVDLEQDTSRLFTSLSSNTRYKIKRAQREGLVPTLTETPSDSDLVAYADFYDEFAKQKSLPPCNRRKLSALKRVNALLLSSVARADGEIISRHAYVKDNETRRVRLLYSASHYRSLNDSSDRNFVGRANRLLHWFEIEKLKEAQMRSYDLGGLPMDDSDAEKNAIARFKLEFGGTQVIEYSGFIPGTMLGRLALGVSGRK